MPWRIDWRPSAVSFSPFDRNEMTSRFRGEREGERERDIAPTNQPNWIRRGFINFHNQSDRHRGARKEGEPPSSLHLNSTCDGCASWFGLGADLDILCDLQNLSSHHVTHQDVWFLRNTRWMDILILIPLHWLQSGLLCDLMRVKTSNSPTAKSCANWNTS